MNINDDNCHQQTTLQFITRWNRIKKVQLSLDKLKIDFISSVQSGLGEVKNFDEAYVISLNISFQNPRTAQKESNTA